MAYCKSRGSIEMHINVHVYFQRLICNTQFSVLKVFQSVEIRY